MMTMRKNVAVASTAYYIAIIALVVVVQLVLRQLLASSSTRNSGGAGAGVAAAAASFAFERRKPPPAPQRDELIGIWKLVVSGDCPFPYYENSNTNFGGFRRSEDPYSDGGAAAATAPPSPSPDRDAGAAEPILLKLNPDGTFRQCNEGYSEGRWIAGRWDTADDDDDDDETSSGKALLLALNRQYYGPPHDTLLKGHLVSMSASGEAMSSPGIDENEQQQQSQCVEFVGQVLTGKFMYPKHHPCFFDQIMAGEPTSIGNFTLQQALATSSVVTRANENLNVDDIGEGGGGTAAETKSYEPSDFYGRRFVLTVEPIRDDSGRRPARGKPPRHGERHQQQQTVDLRAMPIEFFRNNTFQAEATNKILRGRFGITTNVDAADGGGEETGSVNNQSNDDRKQQQPKQQQQFLWFQVSLFGAGRSAPGSVYSEGRGLTHEDKRSYLGEILSATQVGDETSGEVRRRLFVSGTVTFGSDLGSDARPEPVGKFLLTEVTTSATAMGAAAPAAEREATSCGSTSTGNNANADNLFDGEDDEFAAFQ